MYILDTNIISELRKSKKAHPNVKKWAERVPAASLYISVISLLELEIGILLIQRRDNQQGAILRAWMDRHVLPTFSGRILAIDTRAESSLGS
jgi:predicted nucleic acid-binding protein